jgi:lysophospholipase L1-like esterase
MIINVITFGYVLFLWGCSQEQPTVTSTTTKPQQEVENHKARTKDNRHNLENKNQVHHRPVGLTEKTIAHTTHALFDVTAYTQKVERAVAFYRDQIKQRPKNKTLIFVLGGSATGGMTHQGQHFWPAYLQKKMPSYHIQSLALGGATTWHISKILQKLGVPAEYCILYSGHNDRMQSSPRQSLAQLEKGSLTKSSGFTSWVLPSEIPNNLDVMANYCGKIFAMEEYVVSDAEPLNDFIRALKKHPKVTYISISKELAKKERKRIMRDNIHFYPYGHEIFADILYQKLQSQGL